MQPSNPDLATRPTAVGHLQWGKRTRRDIRHAAGAALADELKDALVQVSRGRQRDIHQEA